MKIAGPIVCDEDEDANGDDDYCRLLLLSNYICLLQCGCKKKADNPSHIRVSAVAAPMKGTAAWHVHTNMIASEKALFRYVAIKADPGCM